MDNVIIRSAESLRNFTIALLKGLKFDEADAKDVADALIRAHLRGYDTHGLPCLEGYVKAIEENCLNPKPEIKMEQKSHCVWLVDGDNGLGQIAATRGMRLALQEAERSGMGAAAVRRSNHFGAAGVYTLMAVEKDCIGIITSNASNVTAPFGAAETMLGTNPMSVAVPAGTHPAFVVDMATSEGSRKKVRKALAEGRNIPDGWALNRMGEPTNDPAEALDGIMLPFGGPKGSGISLLIDILSGVLTGAAFGGDVLSVFTNQERESNNGHFIMALKIDSFMEPAEFKGRMDSELAKILNLKPVKASKPVMYPGYRSGLEETKRREEGIPLDVALVETLSDMGSKYDVPFAG